MKKIVALAAALLLLGAVQVSAQRVYQSYTYDYWGTPLPSPETYTPGQVYFASDMGTTPLKQPQDLFVDNARREIYVADTENNRILVLDETFKLTRELSSFRIDPIALGLTEKQRKDKLLTAETLNVPTGIFVDENRSVYIADRDNKRVLITDADGTVRRILQKPVSDLQFRGIDFLPLKVVADPGGFVYVLCKGVYGGALIYSETGAFTGYFGANRTEASVSLMSDLFWRNFATPEQRAKMKKYVPVEFSNLDIDENGFIYTSTALTATYQNHIKKFNAASVNVLPSNPYVTGRYAGYFGDLERVYFSGSMYESRFTDVTYSGGFISALDMARGRVFQYDSTGVPVAVFGGIGGQEGTFTTPSALDSLGDKILVLDAGKGNITAFAPTEYGTLIHEAINLYNQSKYTQSRELWAEIANRNNNCQMAYVGIAKAHYENGDYAQAMNYFKLGENREGYGKAFRYYRNGLLARIVPAVVCALAALYLLRLSYKRFRGKQPAVPGKREKGFSRVRWIWYTMRHPVKGFTDCKETRRHSAVFGLFIALLVFAALVLKRQFTGFPFNYDDPMTVNVLLLFAQSVVLLIAWSVSNWAVSTLADGKGRIGEILYTGAVSVVPLLLCMVLTVVLSNVLSYGEGVFLTWITGFGMLWSVMLLLASQMVVHDYSFWRAVATILLTVALLLVILFICFLLFSLFRQVAQFFSDIVNEINFRNLKT